MSGRCLALALLLLLSPWWALASAQPNYWTALNFRVTFFGNGTVLVEELLHPFTAEGRSLFEDREVEAHLRNSTGEFLNYALLMFTDRPDRILYRATLRMDKRYGERVYCDVSGAGRMEEFLGAYVFPVLIYLNMSAFVTPLGDGAYQVRVRDSFTSSDPRSWIDVIEFRFQGARLVNYTWAPAYANGPAEAGEGRLVWRNHNELEAPDYYIFALLLPGFKYEGVPPEVRAAIREAFLEGTRLTVVVENTGLTSGYSVVWVRGGSVDQARRVFLNPRERRVVVFPYVPPGNYTVLLLSGSKVLDERAVLPGVPAPAPAFRELQRLLPLVLLAVAAIALAALALARKRKEKETTTAPPAGA
jgi:hypothetical protein